MSRKPRTRHSDHRHRFFTLVRHDPHNNVTYTNQLNCTSSFRQPVTDHERVMGEKMQKALKCVRWTPVAWIAWLCTDGATCKWAVSLLSPQLEPLRNRFHHFDSYECSERLRLDASASTRKSSASDSGTVHFVMHFLDPHLAIHLILPSGSRLHPSALIPLLASIAPSVRPSLLPPLFPPSSSTPGWILPQRV